MSSALATRISAEHAAAAQTLPAGVITSDRRQSALRALVSQGLPTVRDENWKYANLRPLEKVRFAAPLHLPPQLLACELLPAPLGGYARYTFVDGVFCAALSQPATHAGITVQSLRLGSGLARLPVVPSQPGSPEASLVYLNEAFATDGINIRVAAGTDCPTCLEILFVATLDSQRGSSYPRVELTVEAGARFGLVERHLSAAGDASFVNGMVNIEVGRHATVDHYRVQQMSPRSTWFDTLIASVQQQASYRLYSVGLGGLSARSTVEVRLAGERAEAAIYAAAVAERQQSQDTCALVEHRAPRARSSQSFRGIATGRSRVAFNGKVVVRKDATGTDSRQSLRGLLAGPEAEIDVRPQLEIYTDDVQCSHGATAGKLDEDMLFYLLSRGLDSDTAQRLLKWAFLEDVVAKIQVPELRRQIERSLAGHLSDAAALQELI